MPGTLTRSYACSLAEYLSSLAAGDSCPCCGAALQGGLSGGADDSLTCVLCGCEVEAEDWPFRVSVAERLVRAA